MKAALFILFAMSVVGTLLELAKLCMLTFPFKREIVITEAQQRALVLMATGCTVVVGVAWWGW